jgi:hypothetical protein
MRLTEQRAINSNLRADGIEGFGAMTGTGGGKVCEAGGARNYFWVLIVEKSSF